MNGFGNFTRINLHFDYFTTKFSSISNANSTRFGENFVSIRTFLLYYNKIHLEIELETVEDLSHFKVKNYCCQITIKEIFLTRKTQFWENNHGDVRSISGWKCLRTGGWGTFIHQRNNY